MLHQVALIALFCVQILANPGCGVPRIKHQALIVRGSPTQPGEWPWHAGVYHRSGRNSQYACGGTLISAEFVVTAAHCMLDEGTSYRLTRKRLFVRLGVHNLDRIDPGAMQQFTIAEIHMFGNFSRDNLHNDIALLELGEMVRMTDYVVPACVNRNVNLDGSAGTAVGWGVTEDDEISQELKQVTLPVIDSVDCLESDRDLFGTMMHKGMFCAGYQNGSSVCNGDSGGGMFFNRDGMWYLGGIVSFQKFRKHGTNLCYTRGYAAFTNVAKYLDWMGNITGMDFSERPAVLVTTTEAPKKRERVPYSPRVSDKMPHHSAMTVSVTQPQPPMDIACCPSSPGTSGGGTSSMATTTTAPPTSRPSSVVSPGQRSTSPANSSGGSSEADPSATVGTPPSSSSSSTATNASTALRRFYFQKTRISKSPKAASIAGTGPPTVAAASGSVPKVVVMGSSTTSEATINTSTDSASTHVTNVTVTTDTETNDSIDLGEGSGQSEPLLSSLDDESSSIVMNQSFGDGDDENITVINGGPDTPLLISYQELEDLSPRSPRTPKPCRTAPVASTTRFPFDPPPSPRSVRILPKTAGHSGGAQHESMFNFDESPNPVRRPPPKMASPGEFHHPEVTLHGKDGNKENMAGTPTKRGSPYKSRKERFMQQQQQQHYGKQQSGKPLNSAPAASCQKGGQTYDPNMTMFPFDREAIDYDRIQRECFAVEEEFPFERNRDDYCCESPSRANMDSEIFGDHYSIFQQYAYLTQQERDALERTPTKRNKKDRIDAFSPKKQPQPPPPQLSPQRMSKFDQIATKFDMMPSKHELMTKGRSKRTSVSGGGGGGLPDLRVDFFAETSCCDNLTAAAGSDGAAGKTHAPSQPAGPSRTAAEVAGAGALATGAINVTPNPMDSAVCTQPRATIVVQQPSLSLDYSSVETILLKNEGDFISVEQGKELSRKKKQQQREDNMRQLLDVTNTLTTEEIKDFEMRYGSPHHSRSQSVKTPGSRASGRPNQLCLPQQRSRVASMPNTGVEEEYYRLRHFSITGKGVVNRGDSLKSRRSKSNNSVASSNSSTEHLTAVGAGSARTSATCSLASSRESSTSNPAAGPYKVLMLGGAAVGKSSLVSQFMTSEYLHAYDTSIDDDSGEKTVSVLLSGDESEITFIDHSYMEMTPENCMSSYDPHGYCVIYSSSDRSSFQIAEEILQVLWTSENIAQKAVILVANKADLARSRMVTSDEGKQMATQYDCKFIETSVGINHNVDELLVGLLSQIRLKLENPEKSRDLFRKRSIRKSKRRACSPLGGAICLSGMGGGTNPSTPVAATPSSASGGGIGGGGGGGFSVETPPGSAHSSPRKYRGSRTSASLKVKGLLGRVWARDSKSKSCENLHVL